ncbi:MAG: molybdopterin-dependent oxidoreductase [Desulfarculaceae bacterium]|nr:molybdopterin-dependent oxidoreductase [Desulfarculaceae bacterium]MCF8072865.1 molybdopterin-dependent oxidoreductase [Desulfarculaceae bacterium]MCF8101033.1 molybdopterin-dependent oxidoreductase [Desulfarculaceae bacterium]MCF8115580.1 molybdopterin-dependent oxidoreductase [Desulfarculaceae bacterium]
MQQRRRFLALGLQGLALAGAALAWPGRVLAAVKRQIIPAHIKATALANRNPKGIDNRNLSITPLKKFGTMGQSDLKVDPASWRLVVDGAVKKPLELDLAQAKALPVMKKTVLLICPGVFSYNAVYAGFSLGRLLEQAGLEPEASLVEIRGPRGGYAKIEHFKLREVLEDEVWLAYQVNGKDLPPKHGFPLRVVAGEHYGDDWVKYVSQVTVRTRRKKG